MSNIKKILSFSLLSLLIAGFFITPAMTLGITLGAIWGAVNIFFLKQVVQNLLLETKNRGTKLLIFTLIKFPLLYLAGYGLLLIPYFSVLPLMIGFTVSLVAAFPLLDFNTKEKGAPQ